MDGVSNCCNFGQNRYRLRITGKWKFYLKEINRSFHVFCNFYAELSDSAVPKLNSLTPAFELDMSTAGTNGLHLALRNATWSQLKEGQIVHWHVGFLPIEGNLQQINYTFL